MNTRSQAERRGAGRDGVTVAVVATRPETVLADYARLLQLAGLVTEARVLPEQTVPPEQSWQLALAAPAAVPSGPAAAGPPWQLEGVIAALVAAGCAPARIAPTWPPGLRSGAAPLADWRRVLAAHGVDATAASAAANATAVPSRGPRLLLANLRVDRHFGVAGGVAALAAAGREVTRLEELAGEPELIEQLWRREAAAVAGAVIDATVVGEGRHATALAPVAAHLLLAGRDPVAVDAVACRLVGIDPLRVPTLARLDRAGLGCADPQAIVLVGDVGAMPPTLGLAAVPGPRSAAGAGGPRWWRRWVRKLAVGWPRPLARRRAGRRYEAQPWGRLHAEYRRHGSIAGGRG